MVSALAAMQRLKMNPSQTSCAIQGFGNVGSNTARLLEERGVKVKALSDVSGAFWSDKGIDIQDALKYRDKNNGMLEGYPNAEKMLDAEGIITCQVDLLVPAAKEDVINIYNAPNIKARLIVEGANGPTSASADDIINEKG